MEVPTAETVHDPDDHTDLTFHFSFHSQKIRFHHLGNNEFNFQ